MILPHIGLAGPAGSGKDTVAQLIREQFPAYERVAFADALKRVALDANPEIVDYATGDSGPLSTLIGHIGWERAKAEVPTVRQFLQRLGVACREHIIDTVWIHAAMPAMVAHGGPCVFTDVRFANEADFIRRERGFIIYIVRPGYEPSATAHLSELFNPVTADYLLYNNGDMDHLREDVRTMMVDLVDSVNAYV